MALDTKALSQAFPGCKILEQNTCAPIIRSLESKPNWFVIEVQGILVSVFPENINDTPDIIRQIRTVLEAVSQ